MLADLTDCFDEERVGRILAIAREVLSEPGITADDELAEHGGTSLAIVRIIAVTSRTLGLDIQPRDLDGTVTVRNLARVARRSHEAGS
ncbi:MAG: acyl carrier protein [Streptosporangiaceae bacterium]